MSLVKKVILSVVLLLGLSYQYAVAGNNSGEVVPRYYKLGGDYLTIYAGAGYEFIDNEACKGSTNSTDAIVIETARDDFNELYASVMLGFANDLKLAFWLDGSCSPETQGGPYPIAISVYVVK
ncbi:hypothetical protein [Paraglaciecola sp.]|uniref:hypothetical protein n=1 Tax=Paraglaciecola sp. TaxID=1920173 RepID=UPI003263665B